MDGIKKDFTESQIRIMMALLDVENHRHLTVSNAAESIGVRTGDPNFNKVLRHLYDSNIVECIGILGSAKFIKIRKKELRDLLDEQELVNRFFDYFSEHHVCTW